MLGESTNIAIFHRFVELCNEKNPDLIYDIFAADFIGRFEHITVRGPHEWLNKIYEPIIQAIPDLQLSIEDMVSRDDLVISRWIAKGTFKKMLFGVSPTNQTIEFAGSSWHKFSNEKICEHWNYWNMSYLMRVLQTEIKTLRGIIPICSFCKKIRNDKGYWDQVEVYVKGHTHADFSHSFCPECAKKHYPEYFENKVATSKLSYKINPDQNLILSHRRGVSSIKDIIKCCDEVYSDPLFRKGMNDIIDLSNAYVNIDYDQVKPLGEYMKNIEKDRGKCKIAVVTNDDPVFGIINILKTLTEDSIINVTPFKSYEEAMAWVTAS